MNNKRSTEINKTLYVELHKRQTFASSCKKEILNICRLAHRAFYFVQAEAAEKKTTGAAYEGRSIN